jgi:hypothetical protein
MAATLARPIARSLDHILLRGADFIPFVKPDRADIFRRIGALTNHSYAVSGPSDLFDARLLPQILDRVAWGYVRQAQTIAVGTGTATGTLGLPGLAIDIPVLVASTVGMVRRHALTYGFTDIEDEGGNRLPLLLAFSAALGAERAIARVSLRLAEAATGAVMERALMRVISEKMAAKLVASWLPRAVPLVSSAASAVLDFFFLHEAGRCSMEYFRGRHDMVRREHSLNRTLALGAGLAKP